VKDELAGRQIRCPDCKNVLAVPESQTQIATAVEIAEVEPAIRAEPKVRKPQAARLPDQMSPSGTNAGFDTDGEVPRPRKKVRRRERSSGWFPAISVNRSIITGLLMMVGAVVWFVGGLAIDRIFFYPPIMFILGIGAVIKGFTGND
jgi:hypothetical protein